MGAEFRKGDDDGYLRWMAGHHPGYVINIQRSHNPRGARLQTAQCPTITGKPARGDTFTGDWVKICSVSAAELDDWVLQELGSVGPTAPDMPAGLAGRGQEGILEMRTRAFAASAPSAQSGGR